jgi:hypothetical protein
VNREVAVRFDIIPLEIVVAHATTA